MEILTKYFDKISVEQNDIIFFEQGIFGFEASKKFVLVSFEPGNDNLMCLQSLEDSHLAFVLMNPFNLKSDYTPYLSDVDMTKLDIDENTEGVFYYVICTVKDDFARSTVNLKCPVVINPENKKAIQIIMYDEKYTFRHELSALSEMEA